MDRSTTMWALVLFFGASIMFAAIKRATDDESVGVVLGAQLLAALVLVGAIVVYVRRRP